MCQANSCPTGIPCNSTYDRISGWSGDSDKNVGSCGGYPADFTVKEMKAKCNSTPECAAFTFYENARGPGLGGFWCMKSSGD